jgi:exonuclease SbcC
MIPVRLRIKNFLSYRDNVPVLDLESIHIACLCGENGHGKSALLDAMTWALWGQARTRRQEDLIHKGQTDMAVELEFLARDQMYRVSRRHSRSVKSRQGTTVLELQVGSKDDSSFRPITGNTIRDTQARIIEILHMDYDTFINTAFLRQGDADRFTNALPTERKAILTEVLDLSYYEGLETKAKERASKLSSRVQENEVTVSIHRQELEKKPEFEEQLSEIQQSVEMLNTIVDAAQAEVENATQRLTSLNTQKSELEKLAPQISDLGTRTQEIEVRLQGYQKTVTRYQSLVEQRTEIESEHARLTEAEIRRERFTRALSEKHPLDQRLAELTQAISVERERLTGQSRQLRQRIDEKLDPKASRIPELEQAVKELEPKRQELAAATEQAQEIRQDVEKLASNVDTQNAVSEQMNALERQKAEFQRTIDLERATLKNTADNLNQSIERDIRPRADRLTALVSERTRLDAERDNLRSLSDDITVAKSDMETVEANIVLLEQESKILVQTMKDTRQKFDMLDQGDAICPVCRQPLGDEGQAHLRSEYENEGRESKQRYSDNKAEHESASAAQQRSSEDINRREADFEARRRNLETTGGRLDGEIELSKQATKELTIQLPELTDVQARLNAGKFAESERQQLLLVETEMQSLDFDPKLREQLQSEYRETGQTLATLENQINQQALALQRESDSLERDLADSRVAQTELGPASEELKFLENKLVSEKYAEDIRTQASELEAIIAELGYDSEAHATADALVSQLSDYSDLHRSLLEASNRLPSEQQLLSTASKELSRATEELSKAKQKQIEIQLNLQALPASESTLRDAQAHLNGIETNLDNHRVKIGVLNSQILRCIEVEGLVKGMEKQKAALVDERGLYNELALAFGKNGIQALIIEDAIPQLEADANELLARLTDNRMSLRLELKEGRRVRGTDALSEELDLSISDELGTRGYETFSGGETFRINFALRIALSRLLARRSGAPLRILFVDEGFGSQDATGQERLTEAIQSIQDDFEKIIVITHIDHVKEAFPVRIEVTKTELGSTFVIV